MGNRYHQRLRSAQAQSTRSADHDLGANVGFSATSFVQNTVRQTHRKNDHQDADGNAGDSYHRPRRTVGDVGDDKTVHDFAKPRAAIHHASPGIWQRASGQYNQTYHSPENNSGLA